MCEPSLPPSQVGVISLGRRLKLGWLVPALFPVLAGCGGYSQEEVDRQVRAAVEVALAEAEDGHIDSDSSAELSSVQSTTTLPCAESVVVALSSAAAIETVANTVANDLLGRDLYAPEISVIRSDVHEIERLSAITRCEAERGEVREYVQRDWRQEMSELLYRHHQAEIDQIAQGRQLMEMACWGWGNSNPPSRLGCDE